MKKLNITFGTILLVLGCFAFSPAAKADQPIVGLWQSSIQYLLTSVRLRTFTPTQQCHSDGLEIETPMFAPGVCMGTWKQTGRTVQLFHVGWTPGGIPGVPTQCTLRVDGNTYRQRRPQ